MKRQIPKNVRQIGHVSDSSKIYVEDYVDTFFNQLCDKAENEMLGAFLIGEVVQEEEQDYIYVYGAIRMQELEMKGQDFVISEAVWKNACETCKEYFGDAEILGWFIAGGEHPLEMNHNISKLHHKYFQREKSLFVTKNVRDKEENFYIYKYKNMMECGGHYVYYEKNLEMQNYMIASRKRTGFTPSEIIEDRVTKNFRSIIREKEEKNEQKGQSKFVYALSTLLVVVILVIGVNLINNYEKMQEAGETLDEISENTLKEDDEEVMETMGDNIISEKEEESETKEENPGNEDEGETGESVDGLSDTPEQSEVPEQSESTTTEVYIVQKGDTLETISKKTYGDVTHIDAICKLNGLEDGNLIFIGQKLLLP